MKFMYPYSVPDMIDFIWPLNRYNYGKGRYLSAKGYFQFLDCNNQAVVVIDGDEITENEDGTFTVK